MRRAVLVSAEPSDLDPWHNYAVTSPLLSDVLAGAELTVDLRVGKGGILPLIGDADLLVIHAGAGLPATSDETGRAALLAHVGAGRPILAMHAATSALRGIPEWQEIVGGRWVGGTSFHPPLGLGHVDIHPRHKIVDGVESFDLFDERYADLELARERVDVATHQHEAREHPLIWVRQHGASTIVYDALGHDTHSYESVEHRNIIRQAARFLASLAPERP